MEREACKKKLFWIFTFLPLNSKTGKAIIFRR